MRTSDTTVAGIRISHADRLIYPDLGISKIQFARYYASVGDWIVPHVAGRPLTLVHCPAGIATPCNYLRHAKAWGPRALRRVRIQEKMKVGEYLVADTLEAVVSLAQMGIVEIHTWNSTADDIERPNRLVWDLDPGPKVSWTQVVKAAVIDYLRNNRTNTSVCAFSPRARPGATVSMPLGWSDLREPPDRWTILTVPRRLARVRADPWKDYWHSPQTISAASFSAVTRVSSR